MEYGVDPHVAASLVSLSGPIRKYGGIRIAEMIQQTMFFFKRELLSLLGQKNLPSPDAMGERFAHFYRGIWF